jgi:hypothetical protein
MLGPAITLQNYKNIQPYFRNSKETPPEYKSESWPIQQPARDTICKRNIYDSVFEKSYFCRAQIRMKSGTRFLNKLCTWEKHWLGMCNCNRNTQRREISKKKLHRNLYLIIKNHKKSNVQFIWKILYLQLSFSLRD